MAGLISVAAVWLLLPGATRRLILGTVRERLGRSAT